MSSEQLCFPFYEVKKKEWTSPKYKRREHAALSVEWGYFAQIAEARGDQQTSVEYSAYAEIHRRRAL